MSQMQIRQTFTTESTSWLLSSFVIGTGVFIETPCQDSFQIRLKSDSLTHKIKTIHPIRNHTESKDPHTFPQLFMKRLSVLKLSIAKKSKTYYSKTKREMVCVMFWGLIVHALHKTDYSWLFLHGKPLGMNKWNHVL